MDATELVKEYCIFYPRKRTETGGQSCGIIDSAVTAYIDVLDVTITIGHSRSQIKNREIANELAEIIVAKLMK